MKTYQIFVTVAVAAVVVGIVACSKSNNPVGSVPLPTYAFQAGSSFQFQQWPIDSSGQRVLDSMTYVHETFVASNASVGGQSGVFVAIDSTYDITNTKFLLSDTVYFLPNGGTVMQYGLLKTLVQTYDASLSANIPTKWNMIIDAGSTSAWLTDTTTFNATISGFPVTIHDSLVGNDIGDSTAIVSGDTLSMDHAKHSGQLNFNGANVPILFDLYMAFNPGVVVKLLAAPTKLPGLNLNGVERDLVKIVVK